MLLMPDPDTAFMDPFRDAPTLVMIADVSDPVTKKSYPRDPRAIAKAAEAYLTKTGLADTAYFGAEAEFFIFDNIRFDQAAQHGFYFIDSDEGRWNSGREEHNLGYRPRYKEGYFPVPPMDHYQDLRTDMVLQMQACGLDVECQHHEVATAGQGEIDLRFDTMLKSADGMMKYKWIIKSVANQYGKSATFMPKPISGDNGSGMHTHQSLWSKGKPLFAGDNTRAAAGAVVRRPSPSAQPRGLHRAHHQFLQAPGARLRGAGEPGLLQPQPFRRRAHPDVFE